MNKNILNPVTELDKSSSEPLHLQLGRAIRLQIRQMRPEPGMRLISERKLAEKLQLDRSTVHRAYIELIKDGVIEQQPPKKGFFISSEAHSKLKQPFPTIGVVLPVKFSDYINEAVQVQLSYLNGIIDHAAKFECSVMMIQLPDADKHIEYINDWMKHVGERLDGIIHLGDRGLENDLPLETLLNNTTIPQVFISGFSNRSYIASVVGDYHAGALAAAEYLCELGHKNIGTVSYYPEPENIPVRLFEYESDRRQQRVISALEECKLHVSEKWQLQNCYTTEQIEEKLRQFLMDSPHPTAFWCINDDIALMTIEALNNIGLKVPEDISVIGYDNLQPKGKEYPLTTIKLPFYSIGYRAVDLLINPQKADAENRVIELPTSLVIKDSVTKVKIP